MNCKRQELGNELRQLTVSTVHSKLDSNVVVVVVVVVVVDVVDDFDDEFLLEEPIYPND